MRRKHSYGNVNGNGKRSKNNGNKKKLEKKQNCCEAHPTILDSNNVFHTKCVQRWRTTTQSMIIMNNLNFLCDTFIYSNYSSRWLWKAFNGNGLHKIVAITTAVSTTTTIKKIALSDYSDYAPIQSDFKYNRTFQVTLASYLNGWER